jgi:hypothetical protein
MFVPHSTDNGRSVAQWNGWGPREVHLGRHAVEVEVGMPPYDLQLGHPQSVSVHVVLRRLGGAGPAGEVEQHGHGGGVRRLPGVALGQVEVGLAEVAAAPSCCLQNAIGLVKTKWSGLLQAGILGRERTKAGLAG